MASLSYTFCIGFRWVTIVRSARTLAAGDVTLPRCVCPACVALTVADYTLIFTKHKTLCVVFGRVYICSFKTDWQSNERFQQYNVMCNGVHTTSLQICFSQIVNDSPAFRRDIFCHNETVAIVAVESLTIAKISWSQKNSLKLHESYISNSCYAVEVYSSVKILGF